MPKRGLQVFWRKMFRSLSVKIFSTLASLIALSDTTSTTLCSKKARSKLINFSFQFFLKIVSSSIFHAKNFRVLAGAVCDIFTIEQCTCSKRQRELLLT